MRRTMLLFFAVASLPRVAWPQGDPLGPEFRVNAYTTNTQWSSAVASDAGGNIVVVWYSHLQDGLVGEVFGQRYASSGTPVGPEFHVNTYTTGYQSRPDVGADASGNFVVVWSSSLQDGSSDGVFAQRYDSAGTPLGPEFRVNTYTTGFQGGPSVTFGPSGDFVVVWSSNGQYPPLADVFAQRFAGSGNPLGPEFRVNTFTSGCQYASDVAADGSGTFIVAWQDEIVGAGGGSCPGVGIFGARYASTGAPLGPEFRVNTYTTSYQSGATVAADTAGHFVFVWTSPQEPGGGIFGQRYDGSGLPMGGEFHINTYTTAYQSLTDVAMDASGNFVVVWNSFAPDGSGYGAFGQRYAASGTPLGAEFQVNTYTTDTQSRPAVAADPAGGFVVTWQSDTQDGSSYGIFGQRFGRIVPVELTRFTIE